MIHDRNKDCSFEINKNNENTTFCGITLEGERIKNFRSICEACNNNLVHITVNNSCEEYYKTPYICKDKDRNIECDYFDDSIDVCGYIVDNQNCFYNQIEYLKDYGKSQFLENKIQKYFFGEDRKSVV